MNLTDDERKLGGDKYQREQATAKKVRAQAGGNDGHMKISERTIKRLGEIITGNKSLSPYRSGPKLVSFFNDFGTNHTYGDGFPWVYEIKVGSRFLA